MDRLAMLFRGNATSTSACNPSFVQVKNTLASFGAAALMPGGFAVAAPHPLEGAAFQDAVCLFLCVGRATLLVPPTPAISNLAVRNALCGPVQKVTWNSLRS